MGLPTHPNSTFPGDLDHADRGVAGLEAAGHRATDRNIQAGASFFGKRRKQCSTDVCMGGQRTFVVVLETGEEVMSCLQQFVSEQNICAAQLTAIGALSDAVLMYFDWAKKDYVSIPVREQVEVASLLGDVAEAPSGKPAVHAHLVVGKRDGTLWLDTLTKHMCGPCSKSF
jgi:predicted DNA-binding protein with PD1-like motif